MSSENSTQSSLLKVVADRISEGVHKTTEDALHQVAERCELSVSGTFGKLRSSHCQVRHT